MRGLNFSITSTVVIITILLVSFSSTSFSQDLHINSSQGTQHVDDSQKWHSNTVDAGMSTGTVILIGVGVAAAVTAIILIANSSSENTTDEGKEEESDTGVVPSDPNNEGGLNSLIQYNMRNEYSEYKQDKIPLNIYLNIKQNNLQFSNNTYELGVAFNF
jgi:hypothetical protein